MTTLFAGATFAVPIPVLSVDPDTEVATAADPTTLAVTVTPSGGVAVTYTYGVDAAITRQGVGLYRLTIVAVAPSMKIVVATTLGTAAGVDRTTVVVVAP